MGEKVSGEAVRDALGVCTGCLNSKDLCSEDAKAGKCSC